MLAADGSDVAVLSIHSCRKEDITIIVESLSSPQVPCGLSTVVESTACDFQSFVSLSPYCVIKDAGPGLASRPFRSNLCTNRSM